MAGSDKKQLEQGNPFRLRSLFYMLAAVLFFLAVISHNAADFAVLAGGINGVVVNWIGNIGARIACGLFLTIGLAAYLLAGIVLVAAVRSFMPQKLHRTWLFLPGVFLTVLGASVLLAFNPEAFAGCCETLGLGRQGMSAFALSGGVLGQVLVAPGAADVQPGILRLYLGAVGSMLLSSTLLITGLIMLYRSEWHSVLVSLVDNLCWDSSEKSPVQASERTASTRKEESFVERTRKLLERSKKVQSEYEEKAPAAMPEQPELPAVPASEPVPEPVPVMADTLIPDEEPLPQEVQSAPAVSVPAPAPAPAPVPAGSVRDAAASPHELARPTMLEAGDKAVKVRSAEYVLPLLTMLGKGAEISGEKPEIIAQNKTILQNTLESFKVNGQVVGHVSGPRVTRYEIRLAPSVKVSKVTEIENNIAMDLQARSLRILAPIPGRDVVGVEVPNKNAEAIMMRSVLESDAWQSSNMEIPIVLGKDISGKPMVLDLAKAPHLLIAGATGSGKSVCMNSLIMSLLMKFSPEDLRLILVDPKVVEMADYQTLPHLITPVIHDSKKVPLALRWACMEMDKRYLWLAKTGVKKLKDFNNRRLPETPMLDDDGLPIPDKLPVLIVIIDELADLMVTDAKSDIETSISRIAAKGRAAGVHIVVATQRPSRDVITGTIKSNLPTRIAFRVVSVVDSRVILDQKGAESLLGMGDMLLLAPNSAEIDRIQGSLVADDDIKEVVKFVSNQREQCFDDQVIAVNSDDDEDEDEAPRKGGKGSSRDWTEEDADDFIDNGFELDPMVSKYMQPGDDDLMRKALEVVLLEKKASTSYIQRRLGIGYNKAAQIIDTLEQRGIVGPPSGSGAKRDILVFDDIINE